MLTALFLSACGGEEKSESELATEVETNAAAMQSDPEKAKSEMTTMAQEAEADAKKKMAEMQKEAEQKLSGINK